MEPRLSKKTLLALIVIIAALATALFFLLRESQETKTPSVTVVNPINNPSYEKAESGNISYKGTVLKALEKLNIYRNKTIELETFAREIATKLNLPQSNFSKNTWLSSDGKTSVSVDKFKHRVLFSVSVFGETQGKLPAANESEREARSFLDSIGFSGYIASLKDIDYYLAGIETAPASPENAEIIAMSFEQKLDNMSISTGIYTLSDIVVWTGRNNKVIKAQFPPRIDPTPKTSGLKPLDFELVVRFIEEKKGSIIEIATESRERLVEKVNLGDINLTTATLEYRLSLKDNLIYPYYKFTGTSRIKETGEQAFVTIIIPAVEIPPN